LDRLSNRLVTVDLTLTTREEDVYMADPPPYPDTGDDIGGGTREPLTGMPRWVKVFLIVIIALVLLVVIVLLMGGHGPRRHM
jgi:hypothetical protein